MAKATRSAATARAGARNAPTNELGVSGLKVFSGVVAEEFLRQLQGAKAARVYNEMADNDATVGALLQAIELLCRAVDWTVEPKDTSKEAEDAAEFVRSLLDDMSHPFEDFIAEALTMLKFGWSYFEIVYKRRIGPLETDPTRRSKFTDGKLGVRKLAPRAQETLLRWEMQDDGGVEAMTQLPPQGGMAITIPITKALLFRTTSRKNNPEGRSILRSAYRSWYKLKLVQDAEAIGIERELAGLPVVKIPGVYFTSQDAKDKAILAQYEKVARDLKFNEQGGLVIPSDVYTNKDGTLTTTAKVSVELLSTAGSRMIDTSTVAKRYQEDIARSALAEFLMMGSSAGKSGAGGGGKAQHEDKTGLFYRACEAFLSSIAAILNRHLISRVWDLNGMDREVMPELKHGKLGAVDLEGLGAFVQALAAAGAPVFPDDPLENHMRDLAGLPEREKPSADVALEQAEQEHELGQAGAQADHERAQEGADAENERQIDAHGRKLQLERKYGPKPPKGQVRKYAESQHPRDGLGRWVVAIGGGRSPKYVGPKGEVAQVHEAKHFDTRREAGLVAQRYAAKGQHAITTQISRTSAFDRYASANGTISEQFVQKVRAQVEETAYELLELEELSKGDWSEDQHPREPAGSSTGGEFAAKAERHFEGKVNPGHRPSAGAVREFLEQHHEGLKAAIAERSAARRALNEDFSGSSELSAKVEAAERKVKDVARQARAELPKHLTEPYKGPSGFMKGFDPDQHPRAASGSPEGGRFIVATTVEGQAFAQFYGRGMLHDRIGDAENLSSEGAHAIAAKLEATPGVTGAHVLQNGPLVGLAGTGFGGHKPGSPEFEERRQAALAAGFTEEQIGKALEVLEVLKYNPDQPRDPAGTDTGGQWTSARVGAVTPAQDLLRTTHDPAIDLDEVLAKFSPEERERLAEAQRKVDAGVETIKLHTGADGKWTPERERLHDEILDKHFSDAAVKAAKPAPGEKPTLSILGGRGGSGKSWLSGPNGPVDASKAIVLNPDDFKAALPEYQGWNAALLHEEASHITERAERMARKLGLNVVHDATMRTEGSAAKRVHEFKSAGYRIEGHYMHAPPETSAERAIGRFLRGGPTGRYVAPEYTFTSRSNERTFDALKPQFDRWTIYDSSGHGYHGTGEKPPRLVARGGK
jgi:predicted ABC-type ATPase